MAFGNGPRIVTNGLVLCLDAADKNSYPGSGTTWYDLSGNGYNAILTNGPALNYPGITLDGTNDYISINHGGALSFATGNYTISVWNKDNTDPAGSYGGIITNDNAGDNAWKIFKDIGQSYYQARSNNSTFNFPNYVVGKWHMYTFTFNAGNVLLYLDGIQSGSSGTGISNPAGYNNIAFGSYRYGDATSGYYLHNQTIGPTLLYNRALSAAEIFQNYNVTKSRFNLT